MTVENKHLKLIITIVDRGKGKHISALYRKHGVAYHFAALGRGTAKSEILEYLGVGENEKEIIFSLADEDTLPEIWQLLNEKCRFKEAGHGIAFTIPVASIGGKLTLEYVLGLIGKERDDEKR